MAPMLWVFAVLTILFILVEQIMHLMEVEETVAESNRLDSLAEIGFKNVAEWAIWHLERDSRLEAEKKNVKASDSLFDIWNVGPEIPYIDPEMPELLIRWRLVDADSRLNINSLLEGDLVPESSRLRLTKFMAELQLKEIEGLVYSLCDWIDRDPEKAIEEGSPNEEIDSDPNAFEKGARNAPLLRLAELAMIPGYTQEVLWGNEEEAKLGLVPWVTVFSSHKINVNTAPAWVLMGAHEDMSRDMALSIVEGRSRRAYESVEEAIEEGHASSLEGLSDRLEVKSGHFILEMEADFNGQKRKARIFITRQEGKAKIVLVERRGFFKWDEKLREKMQEGEEKALLDLGLKNSS
jgi:type II secretory pathway component PulK